MEFHEKIQLLIDRVVKINIQSNKNYEDIIEIKKKHGLLIETVFNYMIKNEKQIGVLKNLSYIFLSALGLNIGVLAYIIYCK